MKDIIQVRQPIVEGLFYPQDPTESAIKINKLLNTNKTDIYSCNKIIVPHGGWDYTGNYIAAGFNALGSKTFTRIIIISNVHREFSNNIIIPESDWFLINGKKIKVDRDAIKIIKDTGKKVVVSNIPHMEEHGIETVLPFVQHLYPKAKIVPILLGKTIVSLVRNLSNIINSITDENTLLIISSNFSGYEKEEKSEAIGKLGTTLTKAGKLSELIELTRTNKLKTCGAGAISSVILSGQFKSIKVIKEGLTKQTALSGGKATYYGTLIFENEQEQT